MKVSLFAVLLLPLAVSACQGTGPRTEPGPGRCGAGSLQWLVGHPKSDLYGVLVRHPVRIIRYGTAVTMDFDPERLNFELGPDDVVARVFCG